MNTGRRRLFPVWLLGLVLLIGARPGQAAQTAKWEWAGIDRIVAIGDIHGTYDKFVSLLRGSTLAFSGSPDIQEKAAPHLKCPLNSSLENELRTLTREELKKGLKDYLTDGQIDALLKRRDRILELCAK